mmetsp:Transcript_5375/g.12991  ORF Transcript_5375/g.12991 Transcript_5375/m.12991 type:complete len:436 (+) Transcript_5375:29-1336(+)
MYAMRNRQLTIDTSLTKFEPPADEKAPSMLRQESTLSEREMGAWGLADCLTNSENSTFEGGKQVLNLNWAPLNSPGFVLLAGNQNSVGETPAVFENEQPNQALTLTLSTGNISDPGGPPPLESNYSGLDYLFVMSREASGIGIDNDMLGTQEDQRESHLNSFYRQLEMQLPPAPPPVAPEEREDETDMETDQVQESAEPSPRPQPTFVRPARTLSGRLTQPAQHHAYALPAATRPRRNKSSNRKKQQQLHAKEKVQPGIKKGRGRVRLVHTRGAHVKDRPEMQEKAREGQKNWGTKVVQLRKEWQERKMFENPHFKEQIAMCSRSHIKSQHECVLRQLQLSSADGEIKASDFSSSEDDSFLGWTGFQIVQGKHKNFRDKIEALFAAVPKENTLNNTFRRAGLVPKQCWSEAWSGIAPFQYDGGKRAIYSGPDAQK